MPRPVYNRRKISQKSKNRKVEYQKVEKRQKLRKMKFCRECATGNQGENCPTACKGDQQSCACLNDGCCKPGNFSDISG